jgi:hypothetical protein
MPGVWPPLSSGLSAEAHRRFRSWTPGVLKEGTHLLSCPFADAQWGCWCGFVEKGLAVTGFAGQLGPKKDRLPLSSCLCPDGQKVLMSSCLCPDGQKVLMSGFSEG